MGRLIEMCDERYASVWDAIENTPGEAEKMAQVGFEGDAPPASKLFRFSTDGHGFHTDEHG